MGKEQIRVCDIPDCNELAHNETSLIGGYSAELGKHFCSRHYEILKQINIKHNNELNQLLNGFMK